jgi:UPF0755 protein
MRLRSKWGLGALVVGGLFAAGWYVLADRTLHPGAKTFHLPTGTTMRAFAEQLQRRHVIDSANSFVALAELTGEGNALKTGVYRFSDPTTPLDILHMVVAGQVVEYPLTLVPGWTFHQVRQALAHAPHLTDDVGQRPRAAVRAALHMHASLEGAFFPDTYYYTYGASATSVLARARKRLRALLGKDWRNRAPNLPIHTPQQALILASLIEKETAKAGERRKIAGVFVNRLHLGMRLETDPTVIFSLGKHYHGVLTSADMAYPSPYNTYLHYGLPPTPIGLCSARALYAALHPDKTRALYFVATGRGGHVFSDTLQAQDEAIRKYEIDTTPQAAVPQSRGTRRVGKNHAN